MVVSALVLVGCESMVFLPPSEEERQKETERIVRLATPAVSGDEQRHAVESGDPASSADGGSAKPRVDQLASDLKGPEAARLAFLIGAENLTADPAVSIETNLPPDAANETVAAAAMGLSMCKTDATERVLVALALRPSHPPEAVEALFSYYRMRGDDKAPPATLPDAKLLEFAGHPTARGRAALAHLGRAVKDPALIPVLVQLARDSDFEVRRAVALALADGAKTHRPDADRRRCLDALAPLVKDGDPHVVVSACRALGSYMPPTGVQVQELLLAVDHSDFNVRVAALESLGKFAGTEGLDQKATIIQRMTKLATTDPSTSVRYTAAVNLAEFDRDAALALVDGLLARTGGGVIPFEPTQPEYVRCAAAEILGKCAEGDASKTAAVRGRLAVLAQSDPNLRVRETAIGAFEGKKDSQAAKDAIRQALEDKDVGIVSTACGVVAKNDWKEMAWLLAAVPARFPGCRGADAREAAISALSDLDAAKERPLFEAHLHDANPAVRTAAERAIAKLDKKDPPKAFSRGADLTNELVPGGAPIFEKEVSIVLWTTEGTMTIRLFPEQAPVTCAHIVSLALRHFYDGLRWHRVVPDFVIQGGCPRGDGSGTAGCTIPLESTTIPFERGTLGMPRGEHPDTGGCQLFICHSRAPHLDVRYTAFGKLVDGFNVLDKIDVDSRIMRVTVEGVR
jgi:peptidyl-prolyl cis-trans isomerase B (cyclophilin B)